MTLADEYRDAFKMINELSRQCGFLSQHYIEESYREGYDLCQQEENTYKTIRRALHIAEMLEGEPTREMKQAAIDRSTDQEYGTDFYSGIFKAMAAEIIKQAEEGE